MEAEALERGENGGGEIPEEEGRAGWGQELTRRARALLRTVPFNDLRRGEALRSPELAHYDTLPLALASMSAILAHMGFEYGVTRAKLLEEMAPLLVASDRLAGVEPEDERHQRILDVILGGLLNEADRRKAFSMSYMDFGEREVVRRRLSFRLLTERESPSGEVVIRVEPEGINLFIRTLDVDVEDAQAAAEAIIRAQLRRGRGDLALTTAREARLRSIQLEQKVRSIVEATRRDVGRVDWAEDVPNLLKAASAHLEDRLVEEREIIESLDDSLDQLREGEEATRLAAVRETLQRCRLRHLQLHEALLEARHVFLEEQTRQRFGPPISLTMPAPERDILMPLLTTAAVDATQVGAVMFRALMPAQPRAQLRLTSIIDRLLKPKRILDSLGSALEDRQVTEADMPSVRFDQKSRDLAFGALSAVGLEPEPLSNILDRLASQGGGLAAQQVAVLAALERFGFDERSNNSKEANESLGQNLTVEPTGRTFETEQFMGDEMILKRRAP